MEREGSFAQDSEKYKGDFSLATQLLEKFKFEKPDPEMDSVLTALQSGEATVAEINTALGQLKSIHMRLDARTTQPWRTLLNESELPQHETELKKAIAQLEELLGKIRASRGTDTIIDAERGE